MKDPRSIFGFIFFSKNFSIFFVHKCKAYENSSLQHYIRIKDKAANNTKNMIFFFSQYGVSKYSKMRIGVDYAFYNPSNIVSFCDEGTYFACPKLVDLLKLYKTIRIWSRIFCLIQLIFCGIWVSQSLQHLCFFKSLFWRHRVDRKTCQVPQRICGQGDFYCVSETG